MIRKELTRQPGGEEEGWLDLVRCATFEVTSEEAAHPLENALTPDSEKWIASTPASKSFGSHSMKRRTFRGSFYCSKRLPLLEARSCSCLAAGGTIHLAGRCAILFQPSEYHARERTSRSGSKGWRLWSYAPERSGGIVIAIAYQLTSYHAAMENFVYLPDSNALVNLSLVKHGAFFRQPNLRRAFSTLAVEIRPSNCVAPMSLMKILQVDLQAVQVDLQQAHSLDSQTSQSDRD
jgi:hypothetical protein